MKAEAFPTESDTGILSDQEPENVNPWARMQANSKLIILKN